MKPIPPGELRELVEGPAFLGWWTELSRATAAAGDARQREEDLVAQAELMSARAELASRAGEEATARARRGAVRSSRRKAGARGRGGAGDATGARLEEALLAAERRLDARRAGLDAARLLREAQERRARAKQLARDARAARRERRDAERRRAALLAAARSRFGCAAGELFLYWRDPAAPRGAFAVALADDPDGASPEVRALRIYAVASGSRPRLLGPVGEPPEPPPSAAPELERGGGE